MFSGIRIHALSEGNVALAALVVVLNASYILPDVVSSNHDLLNRREHAHTARPAVYVLEHAVRQ